MSTTSSRAPVCFARALHAAGRRLVCRWAWMRGIATVLFSVAVYLMTIRLLNLERTTSESNRLAVPHSPTVISHETGCPCSQGGDVDAGVACCEWCAISRCIMELLHQGSRHLIPRG